MAIIQITGFDTGDASELGSTAGTFSFSSSTVHSSAGGYSLRVNPTGTGTGNGRVKLINPANGFLGGAGIDGLRLRFWFRYATKPASGTEEILFCDTNSDDLVVRIDSSGRLRVYIPSATLVGTGTTQLQQDTWYRIEVKCLSGDWELKIDGTSELTGTESFGFFKEVDSFYFGKVIDRSGQDVDFFYDDVAIDDAVYPGDGESALLVANAAGNYQTWTRGGTDSGNNWDQVDEAPHNSDTDYLLSTLSDGDAETEGVEGTAGLSIDSINAVKGFAVAKRDGASSGNIKVRFRSATTDSDTTDSVVTQSVYDFRGKLEATDPATGSAWTAAGVDGVECGLIEKSTTDRSRITFIGAVVDYVPLAGWGPLLAGHRNRLVIPA